MTRIASLIRNVRQVVSVVFGGGRNKQFPFQQPRKLMNQNVNYAGDITGVHIDPEILIARVYYTNCHVKLRCSFESSRFAAGIDLDQR